MTVECPWCDYEGVVESVEAHISSKTDDAHAGRVGYDLRDYLPQTDETGETAEESNEAPSFGNLPETGEESDEVPTWALLAATVLFALVVVAVVSSGGEEAASAEATAEIEDEQEAGQTGLVEA